MTLSEWSAIAGLVGMGCAGVAVAVRFGFSHFHATKIAPSIAQLSSDVRANTSASNANTDALARSEQTQKDAQAKTEQTFERMGTIMADHETRITVLEEVPRSKPAAKRTANRRKP